MSVMSDAIERSMLKLMNFAADAGTFTPDGGAPVELQLKVDQDTHVEPDGYSTAITSDELRMKALISELCQEPVGKTPNRAGDMFRLDGVVYETISIVDKDNYFITCAVRKVI
jgi:hypothetical protein